MFEMVRHLTGAFAAAVVCLSLSAGNSASAAVCPADVSNRVTQDDWATSVSGCELGSVNDDNPAPDAVNNDALFGVDNWALFDQTAFPPGHRKGDWELPDDFWETNEQALLVLKGGHNGSTPVYAGFLLTEADGTEGHWITPVYLTTVNHISYYAPEIDVVPTATPIPSALPLFFSALVGMGIVARRKRQRG